MRAQADKVRQDFDGKAVRPRIKVRSQHIPWRRALNVNGTTPWTQVMNDSDDGMGGQMDGEALPVQLRSDGIDKEGYVVDDLHDRAFGLPAMLVQPRRSFTKRSARAFGTRLRTISASCCRKVPTRSFSTSGMTVDVSSQFLSGKMTKVIWSHIL